MDKGQFLLDDYKLKVGYLESHFSRMWTRFNFFLTINSGFVAVHFGTSASDHTVLLPIFAIAFAGLWYYFSATDKYLVDLYRCQVAAAFALVREAISDLPDSVQISFVGDTGEAERFAAAGTTPKPLGFSPFRFRIERLSTTTMGTTLSVAFAVLWVINLVSS